ACRLSASRSRGTVSRCNSTRAFVSVCKPSDKRTDATSTSFPRLRRCSTNPASAKFRHGKLGWCGSPVLLCPVSSRHHQVPVQMHHRSLLWLEPPNRPDVLHQILRRRHIRERKRRWRSSDIIGRSSYMITSRLITQSVLLKTTGSTDAGSFRIKRNAPILGFHDSVAWPWSETAISAASRPTILSIRIFPSVLSGARPFVMACLVFTKLDDDNSTRSSFGPV